MWRKPRAWRLTGTHNGGRAAVGGVVVTLSDDGVARQYSDLLCKSPCVLVVEVIVHVWWRGISINYLSQSFGVSMFAAQAYDQIIYAGLYW